MNLADAIARMQTQLPLILKDEIQRMPFALHAYAEERFHAGSRAKGQRNTTSMLYVNTGKLTASLIQNQPGNVTKIIESHGMISMEFGSNLVYAAIHEEGGRAGKGGKVVIPARPYLTPAFEKLQTEYLPKALNRIVDRLLSSVN